MKHRRDGKRYRTRTDDAIPILNQRLIHFRDIAKWPLVVAYDIRIRLSAAVTRRPHQTSARREPDGCPKWVSAVKKTVILSPRASSYPFVLSLLPLPDSMDVPANEIGSPSLSVHALN